MFEYFDSIRLHALSRVDQNTVEEVHVCFNGAHKWQGAAAYTSILRCKLERDLTPHLVGQQHFTAEVI